jgi:hypothetical protein
MALMTSHLKMVKLGAILLSVFTFFVFSLLIEADNGWAAGPGRRIYYQWSDQSDENVTRYSPYGLFSVACSL